MKSYVVCILFCCICQTLLAQVTGTLRTTSGDPIPFANVLLLNGQDSTLVKGSITDEQGKYSIETVPAGMYIMRYSCIGFKTHNTASFNLSDSGRSFDPLTLEEDSKTLEAIEVRAEAPLYKQEIDRVTINVQSSVLTKGSSALQVLERSPGVFLNRYDNSISLNGKSGVMVMLDGKLMRLTGAQVVSLLNGMSADNIEKIELLSTPPSKYDADGNAGMINIVTKRSEGEGTRGSMSLTGGYGWGSKGAGSLNVSRSTQKINTYASYSFSYDKSFSQWSSVGSQNMPQMGGEIGGRFDNETKPVSKNHNAVLGMDVKFGKTTVGGSVSYTNTLNSSRTFNNGEYLRPPDSLLLMRATIDGENRWKTTTATVFLEHAMKDGQGVNVNLDYIYYKNENPNDVTSNFFDVTSIEVDPEGSAFSNKLKGISRTPIQVGVAKIDYYTPLKDGLRLEAGLKGTRTFSTSESQIARYEERTWVTPPRTSNDVDVNEYIAAAYSSFTLQIKPSSSLVAGVRYEYSSTRMDAEKPENNVARKFSKFFPSLFFSTKLAEESELQFSYTKRISRPSYNDLGSFMIYIDPMSVSTGNLTLKPVITHHLKLGYNVKGYSISINASRDENPIIWNQLAESAEGDLMYLSPQNMDYQNNLMLQGHLPFKLTDWWNLSAGFNAGWRQFRLSHTREPLEKTYFTYSCYGSQTFSIPGQLSIEISGWYNAMQYDGSKTLEGFGTLNAGIKKELKNNMGSLQLSVADLFKSMQIDMYFGKLTREAFDVQSHVDFRAESANTRIVKLTYSKSFGNNKVKGLRQRSGSADENSRIRKN